MNFMAVAAEEFVKMDYRARLREEDKITWLGGKQELIGLLWSGAKKGRAIIDRFTPSLDKEQYLSLLREISETQKVEERKN